MLLYNTQKEFLGMDEQDLKTFGFSDLSQLLSLSADFADLFIKEPGFVHNFKHIHWIDFLLCSDEAEKPKALIGIKSKTFHCTIEVTTIFLTASPATAAYLIHLHDIRESGVMEESFMNTPTLENQAPPEPIQVPDIEIPTESLPIEVTPVETSTAPTLGQPQEFVYKQEIIPQIVATPKATHMQAIREHKEEEKEYFYNPLIASNELGLPVDLIEEFIQDFKAQTEEFKNEIYQSAEEGNIANVRKLSHKLKGVAANLRIEDALEVLTTIHSSDNKKEIQQNIDKLYKIVASFTGEKTDSFEKSPKLQAVKATIEEKIEEKDDDELILDFKDEKAIPIQPLPTKIAIEEDDLIIDFKYPKEQSVCANTQSYNKEQAAHEIGIESESFNELFHDYIYESKALSLLIHSAIEANDEGMCKSNALKLRGLSENMRVHALKADFELLTTTQDMQSAKKTIEQIDLFLLAISQKK